MGPRNKLSPAATIAALATPAGRGGIGIVRVSGGDLAALAKNLTERRLGDQLKPRQAHLVTFRDGRGDAIDQGVALYFPAPHSFTGEDVLELQGHGSPVVMRMLLARCLELGARMARPGEFSERAFLNGRIDLAQAEAVADLIDAATSSAAKSAIRSLQGDFSRAIGELAGELIALRTLTEATLDFPDEEVDFLDAADAFNRLGAVLAKLATVLSRARRGNLLRGGLHVVLIGQPNVGKSSLLNRLAGDDLAIVTAIAGTTRDALKSTIQIHGIPLHVIDTAGLRETDDEVEKLGIERTWREIERADIAVLLIDPENGLSVENAAILARLPDDLKRLTVINKIDLVGSPPRREEAGDGVRIHLSAKQGLGIELLEQELLAFAGWQDDEDVFIARQRHLDALTRARQHLELARRHVRQLELFAEEIRLAHRALQEITGEYSADDLLGAIFSSFCIGK
ncbi:MAG TPA: tRNA uridine-5-carboxymethylaminomethyl(34) synthesis GTPase MnmE [Rhodocyclaceae bacterium]|nr:tRNA uridine-5-carboxymethylaminomethyl(34) synthesis GTPase MnmE [Rhodocyclaceae bacterium]